MLESGLHTHIVALKELDLIASKDGLLRMHRNKAECRRIRFNFCHLTAYRLNVMINMVSD